MQSAETVLDVLRERGRRGLRLEGLYRQSFNPQLYLLAYGRIYSNNGAMTPGADAETADGMTLGKIERIIDALRHERYRFKPVKRVYIPNKDGKQRPLGLPSWSDKLVGEVVRLLLEAYYEPQFSEHSHGYRPGRGCHTALRDVPVAWTGTAWFIEGDISQCFDRLDHQVMLDILSERIHDNRFLRLLVPDAASRIPGGLEVERYAQRRAAGRCCFTNPVQHLFGSVGQVRRHSPIAGIHPRGGQKTQFLRDDLKLELSAAKTLITHARTTAARFLGYVIIVQHADHVIASGGRRANRKIGLRVPRDVIQARCAQYMAGGKPIHRAELKNDEDDAIISRYGAVYRGIIQYYLTAGDVSRLNRLRWIMAISLLKTLAGKYDSSVAKMARKYAATIETPHGPRACLRARVQRGEGRKPRVATFGGIPLQRQKFAVVNDREPTPVTRPRQELINRLLAARCEICGRAGKVQVHQIRKLADLDRQGQPDPAEWMQIMTQRRRKTLVVCGSCHEDIHRSPASHADGHWRAR
jgi:Type II intron maturase/Reverse transcriptase (RNA-dependent DNA polymerase)